MTTPKTVYICIYWTQCVKYIRIDKNAENITGSHAVYISITKCPICSWCPSRMFAISRRTVLLAVVVYSVVIDPL